ncbi:glycosyltransferase, partial [Pandoraea nosoerga]|nr:glycosyltransferase [Pandoraea nosoerga]
MAVSVILKALNEEARIGPAIESVLAALEGIGGEVIVADGGSRDATLAVAARYPVRIVQLEPAIAPSCGIGPQLGFQYSREPFI